MSINLLDMLKDQVSGDLGSQAAKFLGESESNVGSALSNILPSILGSVIDKGSTEEGANGLMNVLKDADTSILGNIGGLFGGGAGAVNGLLNSGSGILSFLMGNKIGGVVDILMKVTGMKSSATSSLIKMAAPFVISMISKQVRSGGLNVGGLMDMLKGQKDLVAPALPSGMAGAMGLAGFGPSGLVDKVTGAAGDVVGAAGDVVGGAVDTVSDAGKKVVSGASDLAGGAVDAGKKVVGGVADVAGDVGGAAVKTGGSLLKWLFPAFLGLLALGWFGSRGCNTGVDALDDMAAKTKDMTENVVDKTAGAVGDVAGAAGDAVGGAMDAVGGVFGNINEAAKAALDKVSFAAGSVGSQMKDFIAGGFKGDGRFRFNNLTFASGSANISGETGAEVDNLAAILKAYPDLKINVEGYTDSSGNAAANATLSENRAVSVKNRLVAAGIDASRISTKGFGAANPVASNDTKEGMAQNRRIEVTIMK